MSKSATHFLFNAVLLPFYPLLFCYTLWRRFVQKKSVDSFRGQWGFVPAVARNPRRQSTPTLWIHAVSVGETAAVKPLALALRKELSDCRIVLSTTTDTGQQSARILAQSGVVDAAFYFPIDIPFAAARSLNAVAPDVFIAMETELWPNFLHAAHARGVLTLLANGRVSDNLLQKTARTKWLWRWMLSNLDALLMRGEIDALRMHEIAANVSAVDAKILNVGDVKLDGISTSDENKSNAEKWRELFGWTRGEKIWVAGSTHPAIKKGETGEEEIVLRVYISRKKVDPNFRLVVAPRHIERADEVLTLCQAAGARAILRSELNDDRGEDFEVVVLDTVGELAEIYGAGDVAFVGGSLVKRGGHNVLEPVLCGVPVLFGPHMMNFRAAAALVEELPRIGDCVQDENELLKALSYWLWDDEQRAVVGDLAEERIEENRGAAGRIAQFVAQQLKLKSK